MRALFSSCGSLAIVLLAGIALSACGRGRDPGTVQCTPGATLRVGCSSACGVGSCTGDPVLRVCDGTVDARACADANAILRESDDSCESLCPSVRVACPASGSITVVHRSFGRGESTCDWAAVPVEGPPDADEPPVVEDAGASAR